MEESIFKNKRNIILATAILVLLTHNIFFDIYRGSAFNILPHDDYAPHLLYLLGEEGAIVPDSPYIYRVLTVAPAIPFYYILPVYRFSNLEVKSDEYLRALEALAMVSYLSVILISILIFQISRKRFGGSTTASLIAMLLSYIFMRHTGIYSADPIAIMFICLIIYYWENKILYILLLLISVILNEKIPIIFSVIMLSRWIFGKYKFDIFTLTPIFCVTIYLLIRMLIPWKGNVGHLQPDTYIASLMINFAQTFSFKGVILNILPVLIILITYIFALKEFRLSQSIGKHFFNKYDLSPLIFLIIISHLINVDYNVGRIAMYCFPFYLPLASIYLTKLLIDSLKTA